MATGSVRLAEALCPDVVVVAVKAKQSPVRIGVALSSGGAAGVAHIGVLEEFVAAGLRIHCVAGTSAGAVVGAAYAAGGLGPLRDVLCSLTRRRVLWLFDPTWPYSGLFEGRRALELIRPCIGERIEDLTCPYAAVATDLRSGDQVVLREGPVFEALRASIAVPGLFTPQRWRGHLLVDGGLVNPVPVDVARELGAEFVIAASVLSRLDDSMSRARERQGVTTQLLARFLSRYEGRQRERPKRPGNDSAGDLGLIDVLSRASSLIQAHIAAGRLRDDPPDVLVHVQLPQMGLLDYDRAGEAIAAGRAAARRALPQIEKSLAARAPLSRRVTRWLDGAGDRLRRGRPPGERR